MSQTRRIIICGGGAIGAAIAYFLLWIAAALTVYTGVIYFRSGMAHLRPGTTPER